MSRFRHPIRHRREPFGKAGLTVAVLALVLAMAGGAYAAGALSGKQKKEVEKIAKKFAGKPGAAGASGVAGPTGPAGSAGAAGKAGKEGPEGKEGSPWTAGGVLPSKKTETGTWSFASNYNSSGAYFAPISFPIPLAEPSEPGKAANAEFITYVGSDSNSTANCPGDYARPTARPGNLCVYEGFGIHQCTEFVIFRNFEEPAASTFASRYGTLVTFVTQNESRCEESTSHEADGGTWAVTAG